MKVSPEQPAAAPHDVISVPSATHVDDGAHPANCVAANEMPGVSSLSLAASIPANQLAAAAAAEIHVISRDADLADVAVTGASVATKEGIDMLSIATGCGETDNVVDSLQSQADSTARFASAATTSSQTSHACSSQQVIAAAPVPTVRPAVEGHRAKAEDEESHRLLFKAKVEAQHIKQCACEATRLHRRPLQLQRSITPHHTAPAPPKARIALLFPLTRTNAKVRSMYQSSW
jgi:hypothetical protein